MIIVRTKLATLTIDARGRAHIDVLDRHRRREEQASIVQLVRVSDLQWTSPADPHRALLVGGRGDCEFVWLDSSATQQSFIHYCGLYTGVVYILEQPTCSECKRQDEMCEYNGRES